MGIVADRKPHSLRDLHQLAVAHTVQDLSTLADRPWLTVAPDQEGTAGRHQRHLGAPSVTPSGPQPATERGQSFPACDKT